jgi:hypothetical protein
MKIQKIFEAFESFTLGKDKPGMLFTQIKAGLAQVINYLSNDGKEVKPS